MMRERLGLSDKSVENAVERIDGRCEVLRHLGILFAVIPTLLDLAIACGNLCVVLRQM